MEVHKRSANPASKCMNQALKWIGNGGRGLYEKHIAFNHLTKLTLVKSYDHKIPPTFNVESQQNSGNYTLNARMDKEKGKSLCEKYASLWRHQKHHAKIGWVPSILTRIEVSVSMTLHWYVNPESLGSIPFGQCQRYLFTTEDNRIGTRTNLLQANVKVCLTSP